jgi:hypothetical protein
MNASRGALELAYPIAPPTRSAGGKLGTVAANRNRVLVVVDPSVAEVETVRSALNRDADELFFLAPLLPNRLDWVTNDDRDASAEAEDRLARTIGEAEGEGVAVDGMVGADDDVLTAIGDAIALHPVDEVVVVMGTHADRHWRFDDLAKTIEDRHGVLVHRLVLPVPPGEN